MQKKEEASEKDLGYEEWLDKQSKPNDDELNDMERVFVKSTILKNYQSPLNNLYYEPLQGA